MNTKSENRDKRIEKVKEQIEILENGKKGLSEKDKFILLELPKIVEQFMGKTYRYHSPHYENRNVCVIMKIIGIDEMGICKILVIEKNDKGEVRFGFIDRGSYFFDNTDFEEIEKEEYGKETKKIMEYLEELVEE